MLKIIKMTLFVAAVMIAAAAGFACGRECRVGETAGYTLLDHTEQDELVSFREERQALRQNQISQLNDIIHKHADPQVVSLAQKKLLELMTCEEQEMILEGMLDMRGFEKAIVVIHSEMANVLLDTDALSARQSSIILELITSETEISAGNVKIIPIN